MKDENEIIIKSIIDPIYGEIDLANIESQIIETAQFQRLSRIKQLSFAKVKYPSANHTRFEHGIGTYEICKKIINRLDKISSLCNLTELKEYRLEVKLASLLHDIGHSSFSHSIEYALQNNPNIINIEHEKVTEDIILGKLNGFGKSKTINEILVDNSLDVKMIADIAVGNYKNLDYENYYLTDIITGDIGADRIDYLSRDSHHSGVNYGRIQINELLQEMTIIKDSDGRKRLALIYDADRKGIYAPSDLLISRYYHFANLVFQPEIRVLNLMLSEIINIFIDINQDFDFSLFFTYYDDFTLLELLKEVDNEKINYYIDCINNHKMIGFNSTSYDSNRIFHIDDFTPFQISFLMKLIKNPRIKSKFVEEIKTKIRLSNKNTDELLVDVVLNGTSGIPIELYTNARFNNTNNLSSNNESNDFRSILISDKSRIIIELSRSLSNLGFFSIYSNTNLDNFEFSLDILIDKYLVELQKEEHFSDILILILQLSTKSLWNTYKNDFKIYKRIFPGLGRLFSLITRILKHRITSSDYKYKEKIEKYMQFNLRRIDHSSEFVFLHYIYQELILLYGVGLVNINLFPKKLSEEISIINKWEISVSTHGRYYLRRINALEKYKEWIPIIKKYIKEMIKNDSRLLNSYKESTNITKY